MNEYNSKLSSVWWVYKAEVIAVTETESQDGKLQYTVEQTLLDLVGAVESVPQKGISERMGEQFGVIEVSKNSSQESVEIILQEQKSASGIAHARRVHPRCTCEKFGA